MAADPELARKAVWLNPTFFNVRAALYLAVLGRAGRAADAGFRRARTDSADPRATRRMRGISTWGLVLLGVTTSYASFDWLMSLDPHWASTIFGVYFWAGSLVSSLAALILLVLAFRATGWLRKTVTVEHLHDLGKLLFGFVIFWTYIAFCQYFLIWYANFPEETRLVHHAPVGNLEHAELGALLRAFRRAVLHAPVPIGPARPVLAGVPRGLGPGLPLPRSLLADHADAPPEGVEPDWLDASVLATLVFATAAIVAQACRARPLVPVGDPRLPESIAFRNS